ncbi:MAG: hypothetical protein ACLFQK_11075 [Fibrobacterota bacterium]
MKFINASLIKLALLTGALSNAVYSYSLFPVSRDNVYSQPGVFLNARSRAMGGGAEASSDSTRLSKTNPASLANFKYGSFGLKYNSEAVDATDGNSSNLIFSHRFSDISSAFSLREYGSIGFGIREIENIDYFFADKAGNVDETFASGNTFSLFASYARSFFNRLDLGITARNIFTKYERVLHEKGLGGSYGQYDSLIVNLKTTSWGAGVIYRSQMAPLNLGISFYKGYEAGTAAGSVYAYSTSMLEDISYDPSGEPADTVYRDVGFYASEISEETRKNFGGTGLADRLYLSMQSLPIGGKFTAGATVRIDFLEKMAGYSGNGLRIGGGAEYVPSVKRNSHYLLRMPYRAGFFRHSWGYRDIVENGVSAGIGLDTKGRFGTADLCFEFSRRRAAGTDYLENCFRFIVEINSFGVWGKKRRLMR